MLVHYNNARNTGQIEGFRACLKRCHFFNGFECTSPVLANSCTNNVGEELSQATQTLGSYIHSICIYTPKALSCLSSHRVGLQHASLSRCCTNQPEKATTPRSAYQRTAWTFLQRPTPMTFLSIGLPGPTVPAFPFFSFPRARCDSDMTFSKVIKGHNEVLEAPGSFKNMKRYMIFK